MAKVNAFITHSEAGARLYDAVVDAYDLSPGEEELLFQACRAADLLERINAELGSVSSLVVRGSTGQIAAHPLLAAAAVQQRVLAALLAQLGLPDADDTDVPLPVEVTRLPRRRTAADG